MRSTSKMILIRQYPLQWQPFFMRKGGDFAEWKLMPGYVPAHVGDVYFRRPTIPCLFREEHRNIHNNKLKNRKEN